MPTFAQKIGFSRITPANLNWFE